MVSNETKIRNTDDTWVTLSCGAEAEAAYPVTILWTSIAGNTTLDYYSGISGAGQVGTRILNPAAHIDYTDTYIDDGSGTYTLVMGDSSTLNFYKTVDNIIQVFRNSAPGAVPVARIMNNKIIVARYNAGTSYFDVRLNMGEETGTNYDTHFIVAPTWTQGHKEIAYEPDLAFYIAMGGIYNSNIYSQTSVNLDSWTNNLVICPVSEGVYHGYYDASTGWFFYKTLSGKIYKGDGVSWTLDTTLLATFSPNYGNIVSFDTLGDNGIVLIAWDVAGNFIKTDVDGNWFALGAIPNLASSGGTFVGSNAAIANGILYGTARDTNGKLMLWIFDGVGFTTHSFTTDYPTAAHYCYIVGR